MTRLLVLGFGPFGQVSENPTEAMVKKLVEGSPALDIHVLRTSYEYVRSELPELIRQSRPDAVVVFGYANAADSIRLEMIARNQNNTALPDFDGKRPEPVVISDAPNTYGTTLPIDDIEQALSLHEMAPQRSEDAGSYVCNYTFFLLMHLAAELGIRSAGLVHVPNLTNYEARQGRRLDLNACASAVVDTVGAFLLA